MAKTISKVCPKCGNQLFYGHQRVYMNIIVDGDGEFQSNQEGDPIYDSETPYGPFICTKCQADYDVLPIEVVDGLDPDSDAKKIEAVLAIMEKHDMDDVVHDLCFHDATSINNQGEKAQARYILESYGGDLDAIKAQF